MTFRPSSSRRGCTFLLGLEIYTTDVCFTFYLVIEWRVHFLRNGENCAKRWLIECIPTPEPPISDVKPAFRLLDRYYWDLPPPGVAVYLHIPTKELLKTPSFALATNCVANKPPLSLNTTDMQDDEIKASQHGWAQDEWNCRASMSNVVLS